MIQLDHQDPLDLGDGEQRRTGDHPLHRLIVRAVILGLLRQPGIEVRITGRERSLPCSAEMRQVEYIPHTRPAGQFVMNQRCIRCIYRQHSRSVGTQAKIQIIIDDLVRLVELAETIEHLPPHQHARAGHRYRVALRQCQPEIIWVVGRGEAERVPPNPVVRQKHTGMLDFAVAIQQLRPHDCNLGPLGMFHQRIQPFVVRNLDIVVQEQQILAVRRRRGAVVEYRPVERIRDIDDLVGVLSQPGFHLWQRRGNVIDTDDFVVGIGSPGPQRFQAGLDVTVRGAGRDDDRHLSRRRQGTLHPPCAGNRRAQHCPRDPPPGQRRRQRRLFLQRIVQCGGRTLAQQLRHMMHPKRPLAAAQHQIVFAERPQISGSRARRGQQGGARGPGAPDVVRR